MTYLESSALVKRYVRETGTEALDSIVTDTEGLATSRLAYPEILSALCRKYRAGDLEKDLLDELLDQLEKDWLSLMIIEFHEELHPLVRDLIQKHALRAADTVHLASALWLKQTARTGVTFVASDRGLLRAARAEGLVALDPTQA